MEVDAPKDDGHEIATKLEPPEVQVPSGPQYRLKYTLSGHSRSISAVKFSVDGNYLASCSELYIIERKKLNLIIFPLGSDSLIKIWDAYTGNSIWTLQGHTKGVSDKIGGLDRVMLGSGPDM